MNITYVDEDITMFQRSNPCKDPQPKKVLKPLTNIITHADLKSINALPIAKKKSYKWTKELKNPPEECLFCDLEEQLAYTQAWHEKFNQSISV